MPEEKRQLLLSVLGRLKQRVIWKWETAMADAPPNILIYGPGMTIVQW